MRLIEPSNGADDTVAYAYLISNNNYASLRYFGKADIGNTVYTLAWTRFFVGEDEFVGF
jgi:hypothetical protein